MDKVSSLGPDVKGLVSRSFRSPRAGLSFLSEPGPRVLGMRRLTDAETRPVMLATGVEPLVPYPGARKPWLSRCYVCRIEVSPRYNHVQQGRGGCYRCAAAASGKAQRIPEAEAVELMLKAGVEPLEPYSGNRIPWRCQCKVCGNIVTPRHGVVKSGHQACVYCAGKKVHEADAIDVMRTAGVEPLVPYPGSDKPWCCRCTQCQKIVTPMYTNVKSGHQACAYCTGQKVHEADAIKVMRTAGLEPLQPYPGSNSVAWLCLCLNCNREVSPHYNSVQQGRGGCTACGVTRRGEKLRIPQLIAMELMRSAGVEPLDPYPGSGHKWRCQCKVCGNIVTPRHADVKRGHAACAYCAGRKVHEADAIKVMRTAGLEPLVPYPGSQWPWLSRCCTCRAEVSPCYSNVRQGHGGCWYCGMAACGLGAEDDALIYLVAHSGYRAIKIGVGAAHRKRIQQHEKNGWETLKEWSGFNGITAYAAEGAVLCAWRTAGIPAAVTASDMPQAGYTETAPMDLVDLAEVRRIVEQEIKRQAGV